MALLQLDCKKGGSKTDVAQSAGSTITGTVRVVVDTTVSKKQALFAIEACRQALVQAPWQASGGGAAPDADVTAFAAAVTAAGGALPAAQQSAMNTAWAKAKAAAPGMRAKLKELWCPMGADGDLTTAAVKFINGATSPTVTLTNFVSGDYTVALGIYPGSTNTTKKVVTDFSPAVNGGFTAGEWGMSTYCTQISTNSGVLLGMNANSNAFHGYYSSAQTKIGNTVIALNPTNNPGGEQCNSKRLQTTQITGGNGYAYVGGWPHNTVAIGAPGSLPTGGMSLLALNSGFYSNAAVGGYALHTPMTPAELRALQTFFDDVCFAMGRMWSTTLVAMGDSYVANPTPTGPSVPANDYVALVAGAKGWVYQFGGIPGFGWGAPCNGGYMDGPPAAPSGQSGRDQVFRYILQQASTHILVPLGLNDAYQAGTQAAVNTAQQNFLAMLTAVGYPPNFIAYGTDYWASAVADQSLAAAIRATTISNFTAAGITQCVDFYHGLTADPAVGGTAPSLAVAQSYETGVHKLDSGHVQLKNDCLNAFATFSPPW